jgi:hypothetical protein
MSLKNSNDTIGNRTRDLPVTNYLYLLKFFVRLIVIYIIITNTNITVITITITAGFVCVCHYVTSVVTVLLSQPARALLNKHVNE